MTNCFGAQALCANVILALAISFLFVCTLRAEDVFQLPPETAKLKSGEGAELANTRCILCHSVDYISTQPQLAAAAWKNVVIKMQAKFGAPIAPADIEPLVDYLSKNYSAPAK